MLVYEGHQVKVKVTGAKRLKSQLPQCKTSIGNNSGAIKHSDKVCAQHGVFGCGEWNGVTAIFVTWPELTTRNCKCTHSWVVGRGLECNPVKRKKCPRRIPYIQKRIFYKRDESQMSQSDTIVDGEIRIPDFSAWTLLPWDISRDNHWTKYMATWLWLRLASDVTRGRGECPGWHPSWHPTKIIFCGWI